MQAVDAAAGQLEGQGGADGLSEVARGSKVSSKPLHRDTEGRDLPKCINLSTVQSTMFHCLIYSGPVFAPSLWSPWLLQAAMHTSAQPLFCPLPMQVGTTSVPASDKSCSGQGTSQNNCQGLNRSKTRPFPPQNCSSASGGSNASQAAAEGTAIYYLLLLIILGFKFIYYVCRNGNTLASVCLLGIQYPYYSKWFFLHN